MKVIYIFYESIAIAIFFKKYNFNFLCYAKTGNCPYLEEVSVKHIAYYIGSRGEENALITCCDNSTRNLVCGSSGNRINDTSEVCAQMMTPEVFTPTLTSSMETEGMTIIKGVIMSKLLK